MHPAETGADLAQLLIRAPGRTVLLRVRGDSMRGAGIRHGDLLLVERRRRAAAGEVVVARVQGGLVLKRLVWRRGVWWLEAAHPAYPPLALGAGRLWGVAIQRIRAFQTAGGSNPAAAPREAAPGQEARR